MKVYLLTRSREICYTISYYLEEAGFNCVPFTNSSVLFESIYGSPYKPDIILMDYTFFTHDFFNIYSYLNEKKVFIPILHFNDPCNLSTNPITQWKFNLKYGLLDSDKAQEIDINEHIHKFEDLLTVLYDILYTRGLREYIPCMQEPKSFPSELSFIKKEDNDPSKKNNNLIEDFIKNQKLSNSLSELLRILSSTKEKPVTSQQIISIYKNGHSDLTEQSIPVMISRLRSYFNKDPECSFIIKKTKEGYILFTE